MEYFQGIDKEIAARVSREEFTAHTQLILRLLNGAGKHG